MIELTTQLDQLMTQQRWMDAIQLAEQNSDILQTSFKASWTTGWAYFQLNQYSEAVPHLERTCSMSPASHSHAAAAYCALGAVWLNLEKYDLAEECLLKSIDFKSGYLNRSGLALVYLQTGRIDAAERIHLEGLDERRTQQRLESYADFLGDTGRAEEEAIILFEAKEAPKEGKKYASS